MANLRQLQQCRSAVACLIASAALCMRDLLFCMHQHLLKAPKRSIEPACAMPQGSWLQDLGSLESVQLLSTAGHLAFDLSGLLAGVRDVRLTATELQGSVCAGPQL